MKGIAVAISASRATGAPTRSAPPPPSKRPQRYTIDPTTKTRTRTRAAEMTPCPGRRTVPQHTAQSNASPTPGASHDHWRTPQRAIAACPSASEAPQMTSTAA